MRYSPIAVVLSLALATASSAVMGQKADDQISPKSLALMQQGEAALAAAKYDDATSAMEASLAIDPRNRGAFMGLARVARAQGLPGKAIRYYREALSIEPNDLNALEGQGEALVQRGAMERAKANLDRIKTICRVTCAQSQSLAAVIAKGPPPPAVTAQKDDKPATTPAKP